MVLQKPHAPIRAALQTTKDMQKDNYYLHTVATESIKLMSSKDDRQQDSPMHYVALEWLVGFGNALYAI